MGAVIVPLTTAYAFSEFFGYEGSLDVPLHRGRLFYGIFIVQIILAGAIVLFPQISLFKIVLYTQSLNGVLLPLIMYFLIRLVNNKELMGKYVNNRITNTIMYISIGLIVIASLVVVVGGLLGWI
jgi:Mn2+/Fe2+ NRAMP family transporter